MEKYKTVSTTKTLIEAQKMTKPNLAKTYKGTRGREKSNKSNAQIYILRNVSQIEKDY